jgi:pimeloyl-ACP methyl ester carboxylesterase
MAPLARSTMRATNELSVRSRVSGMTISNQVRVSGSRLDRLAPRLILLIHGFQNSEDAARSSYREFRDALRAALWLRDESALGCFWEFHWPGDHPIGAISLATYAVRVPEAREAGRLLALHLGTLNERQEVILVAHSLGCRVALEALRFIRDNEAYRGARVRTVCLLAAAVPNLLCIGEERPFAKRLEGCREHVLCSSRDRVLFLAFPLGQHLYGEKGTAVGRHGQPRGRWSRRLPTGLGHSGYWSSYKVAEYIGAVLGQQGWNRLPEDPLPSDDVG